MSDILTVAKTMFGEARGEGITGMIAVGCVIRNRATHPRVRWWGVGWQGVCLAPFQFSCWNEKDPNRKLLLAIEDVSPPDPIFGLARAIAREVIDGLMPDITGGADHYHSIDVRPNWAEGKTPTKRIRQHIFYRLHN